MPENVAFFASRLTPALRKMILATQGRGSYITIITRARDHDFTDFVIAHDIGFVRIGGRLSKVDPAIAETLRQGLITLAVVHRSYGHPIGQQIRRLRFCRIIELLDQEAA